MNYAAVKNILDLVGAAESAAAEHILRLSLLGLYVLALITLRNENSSLIRRFGIGVCFMTLVGPTLWYQHLTWLLVPFTVLAIREYDEHLRSWTVWSFLLLLYLLLAVQPLVHALVILSGAGRSLIRVGPVIVVSALVWLLWVWPVTKKAEKP